MKREPELTQRLAAFRGRVNDLLLDYHAAALLHYSSGSDGQGPHPLPDIRATALVLRMLTRDSWAPDDLRLFDACWREATLSDLFADEFENDRHRIRSCVEAARKAIQAKDRTVG